LLFKKKPSELTIIKDCAKGKPSAQKQLYELYFNYAMSIAMRYASNRDEAIEVVNDSFIKVFSSIDRFNQEQPFKAWFRQIVIFTSIDHYRKSIKEQHDSLDSLYVHRGVEPDIFSDLGEEDILQCVQQLAPGYRTVFVLYVVEGYKHHEIADMLGISEGSSKSNLSIAREKLRNMIGHSKANHRRHG